MHCGLPTLKRCDLGLFYRTLDRRFSLSFGRYHCRHRVALSVCRYLDYELNYGSGGLFGLRLGLGRSLRRLRVSLRRFHLRFRRLRPSPRRLRVGFHCLRLCTRRLRLRPRRLRLGSSGRCLPRSGLSLRLAHATHVTGAKASRDIGGSGRVNFHTHEAQCVPASTYSDGTRYGAENPRFSTST